MSDIAIFTDVPPSYSAMGMNNVDPSPVQGAQLHMPFCLPQIWAKFDSPFGRGYNERLNDVGISSESWLKFVDALNIAMAGFPPLVVVDFAGAVLGFVPEHTLQFVSAGMQVAAAVGQRAATKGLMERVLHRANNETFSPRGLVVHICTTRALRAIVQGEDSRPEHSKGKQILKDVRDGVSSRVEELGLHVGIGKKSAKYSVDPDVSLFDRHLALMSPFILPVSTNVPSVEKLGQNAILKKVLELENKMRAWKQERDNKYRRILAVAEGRKNDVRQSSHSHNTPRQSAWSHWREQRAVTKAFKARSDPKKLEKIQGKVRRLDRIDELRDDRLLWIVLMNAEQGHQLLGSPSPSIHTDMEDSAFTEEYKSNTDEARLSYEILERDHNWGTIQDEKCAPR